MSTSTYIIPAHIDEDGDAVLAMIVDIHEHDEDGDHEGTICAVVDELGRDFWGGSGRRSIIVEEGEHGGFWGEACCMDRRAICPHVSDLMRAAEIAQRKSLQHA